jgi:hypothetical protein
MRIMVNEPLDVKERISLTMIIAITIMDVFPEKQKEVLQTLLYIIIAKGKYHDKEY